MISTTEEYNMRDVPKAMEALYSSRRDCGMTVWKFEEKSGVSYNAGHAWRNGDRYPQLSNLVAVSQTLGFDIIMRSKAEPTQGVFNLQKITTAMLALNEARERMSLSSRELRQVSSVSMSSFYSWLRGERDPTLGRLVNLAESLGFEIIMRRKPAI
jgi:hypothetical protein